MIYLREDGRVSMGRVLDFEVEVQRWKDRPVRISMNQDETFIMAG